MAQRLLAGFAEADFTPAPGLLVFGQMHRRVATHARDPLCACAAAFSNEGALPAVVVSVDVCVLDDAFVEEARQEFTRTTGVPGDRLIIHATHTHTGPATLTVMAGEADAAFMASLRKAVAGAAAQAVERLQPATLHAQMASARGLVHNRRGMFADGTSRMYGSAGQPGFVGPEGPEDESLPVLHARDAGGKVLGVMLGFGAHPCAVEGECYYCAEVPGETRRQLRERLGDVGVVFLTGPAGNASLRSIAERPEVQPWLGEEGLVRAGAFVADRATTAMAGAPPMASTTVRLEHSTLRVPLRPWPAPDEPNYPRPLCTNEWPDATAYYARAEELWRQHDAGTSADVRVNVLRLGDAALCTNPCELFVEYGLAIRQASPAATTVLAELTDGYAGYAPTPLAFSRGGYETWPCPTSKLALEAGDRIVEETRRLLTAAFADA